MALGTRKSGLLSRIGHLTFVRLIYLVLFLMVTTVLATIATRILVPPAPSPWHQWILAKNLLLPILLVAVYARAVRFVERRKVSEVAIRRGITLFPLGTTLGVAIIGGYVLTLWWSGAAHISRGTELHGLLNILNEILVPWLTAVGEELLFRIVLFRIVEEIAGTGLAVLISATIFGLSHAANPGANPVALFSLSAGMGILLALAFAATRNLWFPVGLHMGWNLAEGFLFGLPNSGITDPLQIVRTTVSGSSALTGGAFGPEGSILLLALSLVVSAVLLSLILRAHQWQSLRFHMRSVLTK